MSKHSGLGQFTTRNSTSIVFIGAALCLAGAFSALTISSSVFPQTDFPRVVVLVDNGVMPADEMMATITRPIEEAMKDIRGVATIRSTTGRGAAEISVFFAWNVDMIQSELYVLSRLSQIRASLPATVETSVFRLTFSAFPILGVSLTSSARGITELWETARYNLKLRFLRIPGVARVDLVGGRTPEYHIVVDPLRLSAVGLTLAQVTEALTNNNFVASAGMHEENHTLYLTVVDGRLRSVRDIEDFPVAVAGAHPVRVSDFARVERGPEPVFNIVTADGENAVLLNVRSQPNGSTLDIAKAPCLYAHAGRTRLLGGHEPEKQIDQRPDAAEEQRHEEEQAEEQRVQFEILAEPGADTGELLLSGQSMEFFHVRLYACACDPAGASRAVRLRPDPFAM